MTNLSTVSLFSTAMAVVVAEEVLADQDRRRLAWRLGLGLISSWNTTSGPPGVQRHLRPVELGCRASAASNGRSSTARANIISGKFARLRPGSPRGTAARRLVRAA